MTRPKLLDLFCGAGGASVGYSRAGFDVTGVDWIRQPDYPFPFCRADAMRFELDGFDAVHASPPCQHYSRATQLSQAPRLFDPHPDLVAATRERLVDYGRPFVIENVPGAPLVDPITLCGSMFGLEIVRHRLFELGGWSLVDVPPACDRCHGAIRDGRAISVFGHGGGRLDGRRGMRGRFPGMTVLESFQRAMTIDWCGSIRQLGEAIPPAYTEWIGARLLAALAVSP